DLAKGKMDVWYHLPPVLSNGSLGNLRQDLDLRPEAGGRHARGSTRRDGYFLPAFFARPFAMPRSALTFRAGDVCSVTTARAPRSSPAFTWACTRPSNANVFHGEPPLIFASVRRAPFTSPAPAWTGTINP